MRLVLLLQSMFGLLGTGNENRMLCECKRERSGYRVDGIVTEIAFHNQLIVCKLTEALTDVCHRLRIAEKNNLTGRKLWRCYGLPFNITFSRSVTM